MIPHPRTVDLPAHVARLAHEPKLARGLAAAFLSAPFLDAVSLTPRDWRERIADRTGLAASDVVALLVRLQEHRALHIMGRRARIEPIERAAGWPEVQHGARAAFSINEALARAVLPRHKPDELRAVAMLYAAAGSDMTVAECARVAAVPIETVRAALNHEVDVLRLSVSADLMRFDLRRSAARRVAERADIDG